jgi:hypothetical protein
MATLFSEEFVTLLTPIFVFLFVFTALFALLKKTKFFGTNVGFNLVISFAASMLVFVVPESHVVVASFTPWVALFTILIVFLFVFFMFFGVQEKDIGKFVQTSTFTFWMVLIIVIIFLVALTKAFGPFLMVNQNPGFWNAVKRTVFHPKTLGALFVLVISAYAIKYLGSHE